MKRLRGFGLVTALVLSVLLVAGVSYAQSDPIRIGALYNLTGAMSSIDGPALNGARLAVEKLNERGGLLGRPVELVAIDTKTDQQASATAARQIVRDVVAAIGYGDTTYVLAAAPIFQQAGKVFLTSGATHPDLPEMVGDYMFLTGFGDDAQAYAVADYAYNTLGARRAWVLTDTSMDFTLALSKYFKERFTQLAGPSAIVLEDFYQTGDRDFSAQITRLRTIQPAPDLLFVSAIPGDAGLIIKQIREAGITTPIASGDGFDTPLIAEVPGADLSTEIYFATHTSFENPAPAVQEFVEGYRKMFNRDPENSFASTGYDAVMLLARAIERAGSTDPTAIRDALAQESGYDGATGRIAYTGGRRVPTKSVAIIYVDHGQFKFAAEVTP